MVHRELTNATFEEEKMPTSIIMPDSDEDDDDVKARMHLVASSRELLLSSSFVRMMPAPIILFSVHGAASGQVFNCGEVSKVATF